MKVLILTKVGGNLDEGMKNFGLNLARSLEEKPGVKVRKFDTVNLASSENWDSLMNFDPDIIHLIPGPTEQGLLFLRVISALTNAHSVATCIHPDLSFVPRFILPDLMYVQTDKHEERFSSRCRTEFIPAGVDTDKFAPREVRTEEITPSLGLKDRPTFLHVGHVKSGRGVKKLTSLTQYGEVLVVGSPSTNPDPKIERYLESRGCTVWTEYIEDISRIYNYSNIYVFPTTDESHSIQFPLSVLEAMACNRPVITTPFGALPHYFDPSGGLMFIDDIENIDDGIISEVQKNVRNRSRVESFTWENIADDVLKTYNSL